MLNKVFLSGYLGKYVKTGISERTGKLYAFFQLSQYTGDPNNKYQYVPMSAWDNDKVKPATRISEAEPGDYIVIEARVKTVKKQGGDGREYKEISLVVDSVRDAITPTAKEYPSQTAQNQPSQPQYAPQYNNYQQSQEPDWGDGINIGPDDLPI